MKFAWWKVLCRNFHFFLFLPTFRSRVLFCALSGNVASSRIFSAGWLSRGENKPNFFLLLPLSLPWIIKIFIYIFNNSKELPHKRIVRNVRKLLTSNPSRVELENLLTALPRGSRPKRNYDDDDDWGWARLLWFWYKTIWRWIALSCCWLFRAFFLYFTTTLKNLSTFWKKNNNPSISYYYQQSIVKRAHNRLHQISSLLLAESTTTVSFTDNLFPLTQLYN